MNTEGKRNSGIVRGPTIFEFYLLWSSGRHLKLCGDVRSLVLVQSETSWHVTSLSHNFFIC